MLHANNRFLLLQLLAEEGAQADTGFAAGDSGATEGAESAGAGAETSEGQEAAPPQDQAPQTLDDLFKSNKQLKIEYDNRVSQAIQKRFKHQKDLQGQIDSWQPTLNLLAQRYGVKAGDDGNLDMAALQKAIDDDNSMYEDEAFKRGMNVEDYKHMRQLEMQNADLMRRQQEAQEEEHNREEFNKLVAESEQLKQIYPDFDLNTEMSNPDFGRLVAVNIPVRTAYEIVHHDEIMAGTMQYAVKKTKSNISKAIQSGSQRPQENGTSRTASGDAGALDPSKLTMSDFARIKQEAERGKRITFN